MLYGGVEAGGTKFVCGIGTSPDDVKAITQFPTRSPKETIADVIAFFTMQADSPAAVGIGSFGPVDPRPGSPTHGHITDTPKVGWRNTDIAGAVRRALGVPVAFDTDVNAAALGEHRWGAARDAGTILYLTVGTGIGGGGLVQGQRLHGLMHPEMGHIFLPKAPGDTFAGVCPFHGECLEGLASGPALKARWGRPARELPEDHPAWTMQAHYLGLALISFILTLSPERVILGGGVMKQQQLFPLIHTVVHDRLNGYLRSKEITRDVEKYIVPPALGDRAGVLGCIALAEEAAAG